MRKWFALMCATAVSSLALFAGNAQAAGPCAGHGGIVGNWDYWYAVGSHVFDYYGVICGDGDYVDTGQTYIGEWD